MIADNSEDEYEKIRKEKIKAMVENCPVIYKYINIDIGKIALEASTIGFSNPLKFNDPYDCTTELIDTTDIPEEYRKSTTEQNLQNLGDADKNKLLEIMNTTPDELLAQTLSTAIAKERSNWGVSCFSMNFNNILMWSHYTDKHLGICIGFNLKELTFNLSEIFKGHL